MLRRLLRSQHLRGGFKRGKLNSRTCEITWTGLTRHFASPGSPQTKNWDIIVSVCLERHPVIVKPMVDIERRYYEYLRKKEFENCLKCDFEILYEQALSKIKTTAEEDEATLAKYHYVMELEGTTMDEINKFELAPTVTDDTVTSVKRRLDKNLMLLVEQKIGDNTFWLPPQSMREKTESLRETAERVLKQYCGPKLSATIYGNAPFGFYKYVYPRTIRESQQWGAKVFYYLAKYNTGNISVPVNYRWLDRQELEETLPATVHKSVSQFLIPE